jgi:hypothetical protein
MVVSLGPQGTFVMGMKTEPVTVKSTSETCVVNLRLLYLDEMRRNACNVRYKDAYTSCYICHAKCKKCTKENYTYATKELPHTQLKKSNTHQVSPANE